MAQDTETSQVTEKPATTAPEPDIDSLLQQIPDLKDVFTSPEPPKEAEPGSTEQSKTTEAPKEPGAPETAEEFEIPEGLKPEAEKPEGPKEPEFSDKVQKRIDELTAKRKTAEERASALETELADLKSKFTAPPPVAPTPDRPLADVETEKDLMTRVNHIQDAKSWCIQHLDGGEISDGKGGRQWADGAMVRSILANAEMMLSRHVPEHAEYLRNRTVFENEARRQYPALYKEGSEPNKIRNQWMTLVPELRRYPDISLIIGDAIVGQSIRLTRDKARSSNGKIPFGNQPLATPAPAASPRVPQSRVLSGEALQAAFAADPKVALDTFVDQLIEGAAAQRART